MRSNPLPSRTALRVLVIRPFIPMLVRNFSLHWRNKMVDWLPIAALRELRELSRILDRCARNVFYEKKVELENGTSYHDGDEGPRKNLMTVLCEYWSLFCWSGTDRDISGGEPVDVGEGASYR